MNYFISGSSGFIGTAIKNHLLAIGESVYTIPRDKSIKQLKSLFNYANPDYIIHLASYGNHYYQTYFNEMVHINITGTFNLLEALKAFDYKKFYNFTTSSVLLKDQTYYSITKHCGEQLSKMYSNVVNIRPYSVYGPGEGDNRFIPTVIRCLNSGKEMTLDENATHAWIYIDDLVRAMFLGETEMGGPIVNNKAITFILEQVSGKKLKYACGKVRSYDNSNWVEPKSICYTSLYDGLKRTYEYFTR